MATQTFKLEIETGNSAFGEDADEARAEIARILRDAAERLEAGATSGRLHDFNGNRVGSFALGEE